MTADSPKAFFMSATLHVAVVAVLLLVTILNRPPEPMKVFEVVAGEGDDYAAKEAPALGSPGVKVIVPTPPPPAPEPEVVKIEPPPVVPAPPPKEETKPIPAPKPVAKAPDLAKQLKQDVRIAKNNRKRQIEKEQAAEARRVAEEQKRLTKEQFDLKNKAKTAPQPVKTPPVKIAKIDEGIAKGLAGGSTTAKRGATGKALVSNNAGDLDAYFAMFKARVLNALDKPAGLDDELVTTIVVHISADGVLSRPRIKRPSGSEAFDRAVLAALSEVILPPRPDKRAEDLEMSFRTKDVEAR